MKKLAVLMLVVVVGLVAAYLAWWRPVENPEVAQAAPAGVETAEIARVRTEARARGEVDVSPCSAGGRVIDRDSGRGIAGALVHLRARGFGRPTTPDDPGAPLTATTDAGGSWSIARLDPGRYTGLDFMVELRDMVLRGIVVGPDAWGVARTARRCMPGGEGPRSSVPVRDPRHGDRRVPVHGPAQ